MQQAVVIQGNRKVHALDAKVLVDQQIVYGLLELLAQQQHLEVQQRVASLGIEVRGLQQSIDAIISTMLSYRSARARELES